MPDQHGASFGRGSATGSGRCALGEGIRVAGEGREVCVCVGPLASPPPRSLCWPGGGASLAASQAGKGGQPALHFLKERGSARHSQGDQQAKESG